MSTFWRRLRARSEAESGFSLVEVMVSSVAMMVVAGVVGGITVSMEKVADQSIYGENAAGLARTGLLQLQRDIEAANPLVGWTTTVSSYGNELQVELGPTGGTQHIVTWSYTWTGSGSSCIGTLYRNVGTTAGTGVPEATGVDNCRTGAPVFSYFGEQGENLLANPASVTEAIITQCSVRVQGLLDIAAQPTGPPFSEVVSMRLANWQPGTQPCP